MLNSTSFITKCIYILVISLIIISYHLPVITTQQLPPLPTNVDLNNITPPNAGSADCVMCVAAIPPCPNCAEGQICIRNLARTCQSCPVAQCLNSDADIPEGFNVVQDPNANAFLTSLLGSMPTILPSDGTNVTDMVGVTVINGKTIVNVQKSTPTSTPTGGDKSTTPTNSVAGSAFNQANNNNVITSSYLMMVFISIMTVTFTVICI